MMAHDFKPGLRGGRQGERIMRFTGLRYGAGQLASSVVMKRTAGRYGIGQLVPSVAVLRGVDARLKGVVLVCSGSLERKTADWNGIIEKPGGAMVSVVFLFGTSGTVNPSPSPLKGERREGLPISEPDRLGCDG